MRNKIEILSPAGSVESFYAAILNGANAVYLGAQLFNARQNAKNFSKQELKECVKYAHARNVLVYLTLNTLVFDKQVNDLENVISDALICNVDAFIIQDLSVLALCKEIAPNIKRHASTQMTIHCVKGAMQAKELGFSRVVLSREVPIEKIKQIIDNVDIETEVFVHGALCMSVSGQCYLSGIIGQNSGNRGRCAAPCRMPFKLLQVKSKDDVYDLSLKDLCAIDDIDKLINIGVTSIKIEGRMKRPEYCAAATRAYYNKVNDSLLKEDLIDLRNVFSRSGFTNNFLKNIPDKSMFGIRSINDVNNANDKLFKKLQNTYKKEFKRIYVCFDVIISEEGVTIKATDADNNTVTVYDESQKTISLPISFDNIKNSLSRLGDSYFYFKDCSISHDENYTVSLGVLNNLRRNTIVQLNQLRENKDKGYLVNVEYAKNKIDLNVTNEKVNQQFRARFKNIKQFFGLNKDYVNLLQYFILPINDVYTNKDKLLKYKDKIIIEPDRLMIQSGNEIYEKLCQLKSFGFNNAIASNLAHIKMCNELDFNVFADAFLNCVNSISFKEYNKLSIEDITLSFEMNLNGAKRINKGNKKAGLIGYGHLPLMLNYLCPSKNQVDCKDCKGENVLIDNTNTKFYLACNNRKYTEVFNGVPLYLADKLDDFDCFDFLTLYFTIESSDEVNQVIYNYLNKENCTGKFTRGLYYRKLL